MIAQRLPSHTDDGGMKLMMGEETGVIVTVARGGWLIGGFGSVLIKIGVAVIHRVCLGDVIPKGHAREAGQPKKAVKAITVAVIGSRCSWWVVECWGSMVQAWPVLAAF